MSPLDSIKVRAQPRKAVRRGAHPLLVCFLVCAAFVLGCFVSKRPEKQVHEPSISSAPARRSLSGISLKRPDPLETAELENFMIHSSGLLDVRPPLQPGVTGDAFIRAIPFQILSWAPRIVNFPAFIDKARCEAIIQAAQRSLHRSGLALPSGQKAASQNDVRTSSGTFLSSHSDPDGVLAWLEERIAAATMIPASHGEPFNVLRYENGQHYDSHMDTFDPAQFPSARTSQRIATMLIYLTDVEEGGETIFKKEGVKNASKVITDWRSCDDGFKYKPRQGDAVLFYATQPGSTEIDPQALHGGCPVTKGEKWVTTKWMRNKKMSFDRLGEL